MSRNQKKFEFIVSTSDSSSEVSSSSCSSPLSSSSCSSPLSSSSCSSPLSSSSCSSPLSSSSSSLYSKKKLSADFRTNNEINGDNQNNDVINKNNIQKYTTTCVNHLNFIYKNILMKKNINYMNTLFTENGNNGRYNIDITINSSLFKEKNNEILQIVDLLLDPPKDILSYTFKKIIDGKSGAILYILTEEEEKKTVLKVYKKKDNLERNIREISIYCTFAKIQEELKEDLPFPKILKTGFITKKSHIYPESPYIITSFAKGEDLSKILEKNADDNRFYTNKTIFYHIMIKILQSLKKINEIIPFSHEDLHPGNIKIEFDEKNKILKNITIIDFDLAEIGDIHYEDNKINTIKRPYTRKFTKCVPGILNKTIEKVFEKEKHIYEKFLKKFDKCSLSKTVGYNNEYNKIKLDRVVVIYYLFIFGYILKDKIIKDLETIKDKLTKKNEIDDIDKEIIKKKDYPEYFFEYYKTLINNVSSNSTNIYFYNDAKNKFEDMYNNKIYSGYLKSL